MEPSEFIERLPGWWSGLGYGEATLGVTAASLTLPGATDSEIRVDGDAAILTAKGSAGSVPEVDLAGLVATVARSRSGLVDAELRGEEFVVTVRIYLDAMSKHALAASAAEVVKTMEQLASALEDARSAAAVMARLDRDRPDPDRVPAEPVAETEPALAPAQPAWAATHLAPAGGARFWSRPDPSRPAEGQLPSGTPVRVEETTGAWARVSAENGWAGWVDARTLLPVP